MDIHSYGTFLEEKARRHVRHKKRKASIDIEKWMSRIDDDLPVSAITIPGTHDSAAHGSLWPFVSTQSLDIFQQLNIGIRYFDLRCGLRNNILEMVHGRALLGLTLEAVLSTMYSWLDTHPREGLIVQIKKDRAEDSSDISFHQAVCDALDAKSQYWRQFPTTPTMQELRGKIQLLRRFPGTPSRGIDVTRWQDNPPTPFTIHTWSGVQLVIQDHYNPSDPEPLPSLIAGKGGDVSALLEKAASDTDMGRWYLNFASAYEFNLFYQFTPRQIALGAWWDFQWVFGINPRMAQYLKTQADKQIPRRYGIVAMDFPEQPSLDLITSLLRSNLRRPKKRLDPTIFLAVLLSGVFVVGLVLWFIYHRKFPFSKLYLG